MTHKDIVSAIGSVLLAVASVLPLNAVAENSRTSYEILVVVNRASGDLVAKGKYQRAIDRIAGKPNAYPFATETNLCVAYSMLEEFDEAASHCDDAIQLAEKAANSVRNSRKRREEATDKWAHAYSNRGVLRAMRGDTNGATADFKSALALRADMGAPAHNLALLKVETTDHVAAQERD